MKNKLILKPEVQEKILKNNKLRLALQDLWEVREQAMILSFKKNHIRLYHPNTLALIESYTQIPKEDLYQEISD